MFDRGSEQCRLGAIFKKPEEICAFFIRLQLYSALSSLAIDRGARRIIGVRYMGTKRHLTGAIAHLCEDSRSGPLLDLFSGMCAVGRELASFRQIWTNDAQSFAFEFGHALFCSRSLPPRADDVAHATFREFRAAYATACEPFAVRIAEEQAALEVGELSQLQVQFERSIELARGASQTSGYPLATIYGGTYFSIRQAVEIEAIRSLISSLERERRFDQDQCRWLLVALVIASDRVANSTGHFAQALSPKETNLPRLRKQRQRVIWREWLGAISQLSPVRTPNWRLKNKSFNGDAIDILNSLSDHKSRPAVIYADPPYTKDQYSRYYGLLDTIVLHDRPQISGRGLTRTDGFKSSFSMKSKVQSSLKNLVVGAASIGSDLIVSYPSNGLCEDAESLFIEMSREVTGRTPDIIRIPYKHSTLGASKGSATQSVEEHLYRVAA